MRIRQHGFGQVVHICHKPFVWLLLYSLSDESAIAEIRHRGRAAFNVHANSKQHRRLFGGSVSFSRAG
jgi:hypothetical protein